MIYAKGFYEAQKNQTNPLDDLLKLLRRIASPDEIVGLGVTEEMTGPAAAEMNHRMKVAAKLSKELPAAINAEIAKAVNERMEQVAKWLDYSPDIFSGACNKCGGLMAEIRPEYPGGEKRTVCPTCLDDIRINAIHNLTPQIAKQGELPHEI